MNIPSLIGIPMLVSQLVLLSLLVLASAEQECGKGPSMSYHRGGHRGSKHHSGRRQQREDRISSGTDAPEGQFPSFVHFEVYREHKQPFFCGGVLISDRLILTAAHCIDDKVGKIEKIKTAPGSRYPSYLWWAKNVPVVYADKWCPSPKANYHPMAKTRDVGILRLKDPVTFGDTIQTACLPTQAMGEDEQGYVVGLGYSKYNPMTQPEILQYLPVKLRRCIPLRNHYSHICFQPNKAIGDPCPGDSGGPILAHTKGAWTVYGLVSGGEDQCGPGITSNFTFSANVFGMVKEIKDLIDQCSK